MRATTKSNNPRRRRRRGSCYPLGAKKISIEFGSKAALNKEFAGLI